VARAFPELRCTFGGKSIVPDVAVFTWNRIPRKENGGVANVFPIAPDWIIEILSPDQSTTKLIAKIQSCLQEGTQLGWLIDSEERVIMVLWPDTRIALLRNSDRLPVLQDIALDLTVEQVFSWLRQR
jgi:Uma2 family endonuclease